MFVDWTKTSLSKPALVILDNHDSRFDDSMRETAAKHGVFLLTLPANTTPVLQPLDVVCFGVFKRVAHKLMDEAKLSGTLVNAKNRLGIISPAWVEAVSPQNIIAAFKDTGIWPVNRCPKSVERKLAPDKLSAFFAPREAKQPSAPSLPVPLPFGAVPVPNLIVPPEGMEAHEHDVFRVAPAADSHTKAKDGGNALIVTVAVERERMEAKASGKGKTKRRRNSSTSRKTPAAPDVASRAPRSRKRKNSEASETVGAASGKETKLEEAPEEPAGDRPARKRRKQDETHPGAIRDDTVWSEQQWRDYLKLKQGESLLFSGSSRSVA